jgi:SAGA-associated factor 29
MLIDIEGNWDIVITNLQDICNVNTSLSIDDTGDKYNLLSLQAMTTEEILKVKEEMMDHKANIGTTKRLIDTSQQNLQLIIESLQKKEVVSTPRIGKKGGKQNVPAKKLGGRKQGRSFYYSKFNPNEPIVIGSEVAYKLRNRHTEEWIQCEVMKVTHEGTKFEIRDPEPDENNNPGQTFKASYKEILLIPPHDEVKDLVNYPYGTKVLARYPETTTFYTAVCVGNKKDGNVKLKFDGEEEVNKETEVERRLVLPMPEK